MIIKRMIWVLVIAMVFQGCSGGAGTQGGGDGPTGGEGDSPVTGIYQSVSTDISAKSDSASAACASTSNNLTIFENNGIVTIQGGLNLGSQPYTGSLSGSNITFTAGNYTCTATLDGSTVSGTCTSSSDSCTLSYNKVLSLGGVMDNLESGDIETAANEWCDVALSNPSFSAPAFGCFLTRFFELLGSNTANTIYQNMGQSALNVSTEILGSNGALASFESKRVSNIDTKYADYLLPYSALIGPYGGTNTIIAAAMEMVKNNYSLSELQASLSSVNADLSTIVAYLNVPKNDSNFIFVIPQEFLKTSDCGDLIVKKEHLHAINAFAQALRFGLHVF